MSSINSTYDPRDEFAKTVLRTAQEKFIQSNIAILYKHQSDPLRKLLQQVLEDPRPLETFEFLVDEVALSAGLLLEQISVIKKIVPLLLPAIK